MCYPLYTGCCSNQVHRKENFMLYYVPKENEEGWEKKYQVEKGQYLCNNCNKPHNIKTFSGYLEPCRYCGCKIFWGL